MEQNKEYNPIGCDHKLPNGFTAWQFQSEEQSNLNGELNKVAIYVCIKCGEISVGGYRTGADGSHNSFDEHFNIWYPDAIDAIIKQANFFNEEAKWCRADDYVSLQAKCDRYEAALKEIKKKADHGWPKDLAVGTKSGTACIQIYNIVDEALSAGEGEKEVKHEYIAKGPDLYKRDHHPEGPVDSWVCKYLSDDAAKKAVLRWNERRDQYDTAMRNQKEDK